MPDLSPAELLLACLFLSLVAQAAICDLQSLRIPNALSIALVALFPAYALTQGSLTTALYAVLIGGAVLAVAFVPFAFGVMGGGDVKFLAAVALWAGPAHIIEFIWFSTLAGGALALVMISRLRFPLATACHAIGETEAHDTLLGRAVPYAVGIAVGGYATVGRALLHVGS